MSALTTQSTTPATIPSGTQVAADQVGTANAPATGDRIQYVKLDLGAAGASAPVSSTVPVSGTVALGAGSAVVGHVIVDTAPSTAVTNAGTFAVQAAATLAAETTKVIGTVNLQPSTLVVTTLSTAATTVTATLPAAGAGLFHYITRIEIVRVSTAAVTGSAVLGYTSTNLPGPWARSAGNAIAIGATVKDVDEVLSAPLKSSVANTATTIVAPSGGTGVQVRITVYYYTAA